MGLSSEAPIGALFLQLVDDGKRYANAEIALYRAKAVDRMLPLRTAAALGFGAMLIVQSAVTALLIGLILWLAPMLGPMGSTLVVVVVALALAGLLGFLAYRQIAASPKGDAK